MIGEEKKFFWQGVCAFPMTLRLNRNERGKVGKMERGMEEEVLKSDGFHGRKGEKKREGKGTPRVEGEESLEGRGERGRRT